MGSGGARRDGRDIWEKWYTHSVDPSRLTWDRPHFASQAICWAARWLNRSVAPQNNIVAGLLKWERANVNRVEYSSKLCDLLANMWGLQIFKKVQWNNRAIAYRRVWPLHSSQWEKVHMQQSQFQKISFKHLSAVCIRGQLNEERCSKELTLC